MRKTTVIRNLGQARQWLLDRRKKPSKSGEPWEAENIMVACVQLCAQCGKRLTDWLDRQAGRATRRKVLRRIRERYNQPDGSRVLCRLIELTISELRACSWRDEFEPAPLRIKIQKRPLTEAHKRAIRQAHRRNREERQKALQARLEHETGSDTANNQGAEKTAVFPELESPLHTALAIRGIEGTAIPAE